MVSMFQKWRFQRWRQASLWTTKKIRRQRIKSITRRRSESNARGACRIIGGNSTSRFCTRAMGMIQKQRNWVPYELKPRDEKRFFTCVNSWFKDNREKVFLHRIVTGSGYSTTTPRRKNTTLSLLNRCHRSQYQHHGQTFMVRRSDGTKRVLFIMSCWNLVIPLPAISYNSFKPCIARKTARAKTW